MAAATNCEPWGPVTRRVRPTPVAAPRRKREFLRIVREPSCCQLLPATAWLNRCLALRRPSHDIRALRPRQSRKSLVSHRFAIARARIATPLHHDPVLAGRWLYNRRMRTKRDREAVGAGRNAPTQDRREVAAADTSHTNFCDGAAAQEAIRERLTKELTHSWGRTTMNEATRIRPGTAAELGAS